MINPDLNRPAASQAGQASLFDTIVFPGDAFSEAFLSPTSPREHWRSLVAALDATGPDVLNKRQERVRRMRHEDGATYNPFDDPTGRGTPWALEMIPLPLTAGEWAGLEATDIGRGVDGCSVTVFALPLSHMALVLIGGMSYVELRSALRRQR